MSKSSKKNRQPVRANNVFIGVIIGIILISLALTAIFTKATSAGSNDYSKTYSGTVNEYCGTDCWLGDPDNKIVIYTNEVFASCAFPFEACEGGRQSIKVNGKTKNGSGFTRHYNVTWVSSDVCNQSDVPTGNIFCLYPHFQVTVTQGSFVE